MSGEFEVAIDLPKGKALIVQKYNDEYSLVSGYKSKKTGAPGMEWCYPQEWEGKEKRAKKTAVPWQIKLGSWEDGQAAVRQLAEVFKVKISPVTCPQCGEVIKADDDGIPF